MTEEEKKRQQQQQAQQKKRQAAQAAAKARAQQQDAQAAEQAVANVESEKPQATFAEQKAQKSKETKANVQTFLGNNRGGKMTTLESVYQNAKPKEERQAEVDAYNRQEQQKADREWDKKTNESYKDAGSKVTKAGEVDPLLKGTSAEKLFPELVKNGTIDVTGGAANQFVTGTKHNLDPAKIASVQDLAHIASALTDEKDKYAVIDAYAKNNKLNADDVYWQVEQYSGGRVFSSPVSARGKATEIGVYNDYGEKLDPSKMTADQFWRAMELTYDSEDQAILLDVYKKLYPDYNVKGLKAPGFLESADMTKSEYNKRVDEMNASFTVGASEANSNAYMDQLNALREEYAGNQRVLAQMERALLKSYERITNKKAPTNDEVQAAMEARAMEEKLATVSGEKAAEKAEKTYWQVFDAQPDAPSSYGAAASEVDVEEVEPVEEATGYNYGGGGGSASSYAAASSASMPTVNPSEQAGAQASEVAAETAAVVANALESPLGQSGAERNAPVTAGNNGAAPAMSGRGTVKGNAAVSGGQTSVETLPYNPNMTDDEVLAAYSAGYAVDERNMAGLKPLLDNPNARGILMDTHGVYANVRQEGGGSRLVNMNQHYGYAIGSAAAVLDNGSLPADLEGLGRRELASLVNEIDEGVRLGTIQVPAGANQYAYAIAENEAYQARVQRVAGLQKEADAAYLEQVQKEKEAEETVIADIKARMMSGKPVSEAELGMVAEKYKGTRGDITDDETVLKYYREIGKNKLFADNSEYWTRDSAAAQSAGVLLAQPRKSEFNKFKNVLYNETKNVVEDYARMALGMGVSLEELLVSAGLDEPSKLADVAYNNVISRGEAFSKDEEAQAAIDAINNAAASEHNVLTATGLGARYGIEKYASGFAKTSYMILDDADYAEAVLDLEREYTAQYGDLGRYMYRKQLTDYANSGEMSQEAAADLLANISHARDIFDIGYELDPGFLEGFARNNYEAIQKDVEQLEAVASTLTPRLQKWFSGAYSLAYSGAAMVTSALVGGVAGKAGASANVASTVGAAAGTGFPSYADAYTDNIQNKKMPPGLAKAMAFFESMALTALNVDSTGVDIETFWGDSTYSLLKGAMTGKGGSSMIKLLGRWFSRSASEGIQEDTENLIGKGFDAISDAAVMLESGRPVPLSKLCGSVMDNVYETDPVELFSELATDFGAGFAMSGVLSLAGAAKAFGQARTGAKMQGQYSSIDLATQLVEGNLEFNEENVGKVYAALKQDMLDARFRKYIDSGHVAAVDQRANMIAVAMGTGEADRVKAVEYAQMAEEHSAKAEAARAARDAAQGTYWELRDRLASGDLSVQAALESARMQWQKAQTSLAEAESASSKALDNSKQAMEVWLAACRQQSGAVRGWMLEEQANNMIAARQAAAEKLAAQYEAEEAEREMIDAGREGLTVGDFSNEAYSDYYEETGSDTAAEAEEDAVDVDKILVESELIRESQESGLATEGELETLESNKDALLSYMIDLMTRAKRMKEEMGDLDAHDEIAKQYNELRDKFEKVFGEGKLVPKIKLEADNVEQETSGKTVVDPLVSLSNADKKVLPSSEAYPDPYSYGREGYSDFYSYGSYLADVAEYERAAENARADKAAKEAAEAEAQAAKEAERTREVEMIEGAVFTETETDAESDAEESVDTDALISQIADIQSRIDEAKNMGADADTIAALEAELEPLNAQKQKAIEEETREFDMLYDMQMAAAEADADDDYYQSLNDAYMASMDRLEAMGADVESIIARQSGKAAKSATEQEATQNNSEANQNTQEAAQETNAPKVAKPRKIKPKKGKKETAAQRKQREQTESIRRRREATDAKLAEYKGASDFIAKTPIYVNESQEQKILREVGSKTLTEANGRYRARLTNNKKRTDAIPVENALPELVAESGAIVDAESTTPEMELAKVMNAVQKLRDDRRQEWAEARAIEEKKRKAKEKRREEVSKLTAKEEAQAETDAKQDANTETNATQEANTGVSALAVGSSADTGVSTLSVESKSEPAEEATKKGKKLVTSALKAVEKLADEIDVGFRIKGKNRFQSANAQFGNNVLGYYKHGQRNAVVRSAEAGRLEVSGHEIGHAVQEQLGIASTKAMIDGWKKNFKNVEGYTEAEYSNEAFAEFFWRYLRGRDAAVVYSDESSVEAFEYALRQHKKLRNAVEKAQASVSAYFDSSDTGAKIGANVVRMYEDGKKSIFDKKASDWVAEYVDDTVAVEPFQDIIRERLGQGHLPFDVNLRDTIRHNRRASARAVECITKNLVDNNGNVVDIPLTKVFEKITGNDYDLFIEWWLARHSLDRNRVATERAQREAGDNAKDVAPVVNQVFDESALNSEELKRFIAETEAKHPEFRETVERFQKWRRTFFDVYLVSNGLLGDQARATAILDELEKMYPFYAPTHRAGKGDKHVFKPHNVKGSTETIIDPFEYFVSMVGSIVSQTAENDNKKKFVKIFDAFSGSNPGMEGKGVGWFANELVPDAPASEGDMNAFRKKLETILNSDSEDADVISHIGSLYADDEVRFGGKRASSMQNVISVRDENGNTRYFEIYNPDMYQLLASVTGQSGQNEKGFEDAIGKLTRTMSMLTTGSNPVFAITNAMRDFQNSVNYGSWATSYIDGAAKWLATLKDVVTNSEVSQEYDRLGGGGWSQFDTKTKRGSEELRGEAFKGYNSRNIGQIGKTAGRVLWKVATFESINAAIEKTSRLVEYKYGKHDRSTADGRIEAFLAAQDVTTDFARRGKTIKAKWIRAVIPFANASMQGVYRNARQFSAQESDRAKARLAKQITNTAMASLLTNGLLMACLDDDEKKEYALLSPDLVTKHLFIPNWNREKGEPMLYRIPLDQNPISYAINAAVSNMVWKGETGDDFLVGMAAVADVVLANLIPVNSTIFDPMVATVSNKNWYGSNIVPTYLESNSVVNRYTEETPTAFVDMAKGLRRITFGKVEVSPMMLQYLAEQYTGYIGQTVIPALPSEKNKNGIITGWFSALAATARKRITSDPLMSNDVISDVYDSLDRMEEVSKEGRSKRNFDISYLSPALSPKEVENAVQEAYKLSHSGGEIYEAKKRLGELSDEIDAINAREGLTSKQKYLLTNDVRREKVEIALDIKEIMEDYNARYRYKGTMMTVFEDMLKK